MITVAAVTKRYGGRAVVDSVDLEVRAGEVVGLVGPNGAGKSTLLRMAVALVRPTSGGITFDGVPYQALERPLTVVGAVLTSGTAHRRLTSREHLTALARSHGLQRSRVDEVLERTGLSDVGGRQLRHLSLGMGQRWAIAAALLGHPRNLVLDEPSNALDPVTVVWLRGLIRDLAAGGCSVLVSSHLLDEVARTCGRVLVMARGRVLDDIDPNGPEHACVRIGGTDDVMRVLLPLLERCGASVRPAGESTWDVSGASVDEIGQVALERRLLLRRLEERSGSIEERVMTLTQENTDLPVGVPA